MKLKFQDRFNRVYLHESYMLNRITYDESQLKFACTRNTLPSIFSLKGHIVWCDVNLNNCCSTGPARVQIDGVVEYWLNGLKVTAMEVLLS